MFKQFLQSGAMDYCQIDAARLGGVNEILAVILMARKFGGKPIVYFMVFLRKCRLVRDLIDDELKTCSSHVPCYPY